VKRATPRGGCTGCGRNEGTVYYVERGNVHKEEATAGITYIEDFATQQKPERVFIVW